MGTSRRSRFGSPRRSPVPARMIRRACSWVKRPSPLRWSLRKLRFGRFCATSCQICSSFGISLIGSGTSDHDYVSRARRYGVPRSGVNSQSRTTSTSETSTMGKNETHRGVCIDTYLYIVCPTCSLWCRLREHGQ